MNMSEEDIIANIKEKKVLQVPRLPCHTHAVERTKKLVAEASLKITGQERRDGHVMSKIRSYGKAT